MCRFNFFVILLLPAFLGIASLATPLPNRSIISSPHAVDKVVSPAFGLHFGNIAEKQSQPIIQQQSGRSANTCADPSIARVAFQAFSGSRSAHILRFHGTMVTLNTQQSNGPEAWSFQGPVFKAWSSQQQFTVPLWQLANPAETEFIFAVGVDAQTPPIVSGFETSPINLVAWVYNTSVCGSVPLMSAAFPSQSDHYYTTDPDEQAELLENGWTDTGVVAFVLPLPSF